VHSLFLVKSNLDDLHSPNPLPIALKMCRCGKVFRMVRPQMLTFRLFMDVRVMHGLPLKLWNFGIVCNCVRQNNWLSVD